MGFTEILTLVFVVLKILGVITWSWWVVFLPEILAGVFYLACFILAVLGVKTTTKTVEKTFKDFKF